MDELDEDVRLPLFRLEKGAGKQAQKRPHKNKIEKQGRRQAKDKQKTAVKRKMEEKVKGQAEDHFVGAPSQWVEVWSPRVKVTLLPYGVAECSHVRGQLEQCNLEGCHSGREYPACHKEKPYPKHPIDSDSLLPLPPATPPALLADQKRHACGAAFEEDKRDVRLLVRALKQLQRPSDCSRARLMVYYHQRSGLASELHKLALALSLALMTNRTLVVAESAGWGYADPSVCGNTTVSCHMSELNSVCKEADAGGEAPQIVMGRCCWMNDSMVTHPHRVMRVNQTTIEQEKLSLYYKTVPARFAKRGLFWWRAQLVSFIFQLKPHMRAGPSPRFHVSAHIRHDNIAEADPIPTSSYTAQMAVAANMMALSQEQQQQELQQMYHEAKGRPPAERGAGVVGGNGERRGGAGGNTSVAVFVACDTPETDSQVLSQMARHNRSGAAAGRIVVHLEDARQRRKGTHSRTHTHAETRDIFEAIQRLTDADMFVGKFSSGVSRLIAELGCARGRFRHKPVSVDRQWGTTCP